MIFKEFGNKKLPTIVLLHGGGLSWWSLQPQIEFLRNTYHMIVPVIDGHGENGDETFVSIGDSAAKLLAYLDQYYGGRVFALYGLSIGGQIVTEVLTLRPDIAAYAVIESALVIPIQWANSLIVPAYQLCYAFVKQKWFSKWQAKALCLPGSLFEQYYTDSLKISKQSLINISLSNGNFSLSPKIASTKAKVLIIVGDREATIMRQSAEKLHKTIAQSQLLIAKNCKHGQFSLQHPNEFTSLLSIFLTNHSPAATDSFCLQSNKNSH